MMCIHTGNNKCVILYFSEPISQKVIPMMGIHQEVSWEYILCSIHTSNILLELCDRITLVSYLIFLVLPAQCIQQSFLFSVFIATVLLGLAAPPQLSTTQQFPVIPDAAVPSSLFPQPSVNQPVSKSNGQSSSPAYQVVLFSPFTFLPPATHSLSQPSTFYSLYTFTVSPSLLPSALIPVGHIACIVMSWC